MMLLRAGLILPGTRGQALTDAAVLIDGDAITAVGPRETIDQQVPPGIPTRDFPNGTILPGLINAHVHLTFDAASPPGKAVEAYPDDGDMLDAMAARAEGLLRSGVTTARDLGDRGGLGIKMREQVAAGQRVGPRLLAAAVPLTPPGGHCWFLGGEVNGEADIRAQVRRLAVAGADVIKLMASGGATTEGKYGMADCQFTAAEIAGAVEEAHAHGLPVAAHAHGAESIARAVDAGVDSIEHGTWVNLRLGLGSAKRCRRSDGRTGHRALRRQPQ